MDAIRAVALFHNPRKPMARQALPGLKAWLKKRGIASLGPAQASRAQAALALGGDGTLLAAARSVAPLGVPVVGVNVGRLGFLAAADLKRIHGVLDGLSKGRLALSSRMMLRARLSRGRGGLALNDCVIRSGSAARVVRLSAWVNGEYLGTYVGDGLILATPTGSTAYSLAAQGPIVAPELDLMLLTPICSHSLTQRPVILPPESDVEVRLEDYNRQDPVVLSLDGQVNIPLKVGDRVSIRRAPERFRLFVCEGQTYFSLLRRKLKWGE